jgi:hypothetical protein
MIKPQDLRIGNLVFFDEDGINSVQEVKYIGYNNEGFRGYYVSFGWASTTLEDHFNDDDLHISGIPVTEVRLKTLGFKKVPNFTVMNSMYIDIGRSRQLSIGGIGTANLMMFLNEIEMNTNKEIIVKDCVVLHNWDYDGELYVHKLQNLYNALTVEELIEKK